MSTQAVEPLVPFTGDPIGGPKPASEVVIPYQGGVVRQSPEAQQASKAAEQFAQSFPQFGDALKKGINNLSAPEQQRLNELRRQMRSTPPRPATVINLHPWPLTFGSTNRFLRGITIPAAHPGTPYAFQHIRSYRTDWQNVEDGSLEFKPLLPIHLAAEFVREFSNADSYGGGVLIYEGEGNPEKVHEVETYDPQGRAITVAKPGIEYDEENNQHRVMIDEPVKMKLVDLLEAARRKRNAFYLARVQRADQDYRRPDGKGKSLVTPVHTLMADVLFAEGIIAAVPEWDLKGRMESGLRDENCPACGAQPKEGTFKCPSCNHILDPYEAYMNGAIEYGHASLEMLTADELVQVETEKDRRAAQKTEAKAKIKAAKEAAKAQPE